MTNDPKTVLNHGVLYHQCLLQTLTKWLHFPDDWQLPHLRNQYKLCFQAFYSNKSNLLRISHFSKECFLFQIYLKSLNIVDQGLHRFLRLNLVRPFRKYIIHIFDSFCLRMLWDLVSYKFQRRLQENTIDGQEYR